MRLIHLPTEKKSSTHDKRSIPADRAEPSNLDSDWMIFPCHSLDVCAGGAYEKVLSKTEKTKNEKYTYLVYVLFLGNIVASSVLC